MMQRPRFTSGRGTTNHPSPVLMPWDRAVISIGMKDSILLLIYLSLVTSAIEPRRYL